ncbi:MAG: TIGR02300 family protein [Bauldia sp.]
MAKAQLGTKRICPNCGARYYDLNHNPIICPRCGTRFEVAAAPTRARAAPAKVVPEEVEVEIDVKDPVEVVSLEEADDEAAAAGAVKVEGVEDDEEEIEKEEEDDTFLAEEDEEDDVEDIIGDVDDEET